MIRHRPAHTEESHEDPWLGCPRHRRQPRPRPAFARELVERGAAKVYAAARNPRASPIPACAPSGSTSPIPARRRRRAGAADVTLLINNAG